MKFNGTTELNVDREETWKYFTDPDVLERCAPGCKSMTMTSPSELDATLAVGVGSVKPTFDVDVVVTETEYPTRLGMVATGSASRNAFDTTAEMVLEEVDENRTEIHWEASADVSGLLASLGQRALDSVTHRLVNSFFDDIEEVIEAGEPAVSRLEEKGEAESDVDSVDTQQEESESA